MNSIVTTTARQPRRCNLPVCDVGTYLREVAYVAREAATNSDPRVLELSAQLLALQTPTLAAIARESR